MSYDLYCYKSVIGKPDIKEAIRIVESDEDRTNSATNAKLKLQIAMKLVAYNPTLEGFRFDYEELARMQGTTVAEARKNFDHLELNTPANELATQITIFDHLVVLAIPYWYTDGDADEVFSKVNIYMKIISQTAGYYVYDPQLVNVYDPMLHDFEGLSVYKKLTTKKEEIAQAQQATAPQAPAKKPWWKLW